MLSRKSCPDYSDLYQTLVLLACCHTVIYERKAGQKASYSAESPDELALIESLQQFGFEFSGRDQSNVISVRTKN